MTPPQPTACPIEESLRRLVSGPRDTNAYDTAVLVVARHIAEQQQTIDSLTRENATLREEIKQLGGTTSTTKDFVKSKPFREMRERSYAAMDAEIESLTTRMASVEEVAAFLETTKVNSGPMLREVYDVIALKLRTALAPEGVAPKSSTV